MKHKFFFFLLLCICISINVLAQNGILKGTVSTVNGETVPTATISIKDCNKAGMSDTTGTYEINQIPPGDCEIECRCMGYKSFRKKVYIKPGGILEMNIQLQDTITELNHVEITGKSQVQELKEGAQTISVIDTKALQAQSSGSIDIVNKAMGIKVRQAGGLGGEATISINGLSGKQIKFFIDGVPSDYLGNGLSINVLPVSLIDRIEIYKGVVPIDLGADALGGAMNIVTRKNITNYLDASYSIGSFNTHKASLNTYYLSDSTHFFTALNTFYNYSDNNYFIDAEIPDENGVPLKKKVKRFHDAYQNYLGSLESGVINTSWANLFSLTVSTSGMNDKVQNNPTTMEQPYGRVTRKENTVGAAVKFQKKNVVKNLDVNFYSSYNHISSLTADTSIYSYTWDGNIYQFQGKPVIHPFVGEKSSNRKLLYFNSDNVVGRINLKYRLNATSSIFSNVVTSFYERKGHDTIQEKYYGRNYFQQPESMLKNVCGIAFEKLLFRNSLISITSVKNYYYKATGFEINPSKEQVVVSQVKYNNGFNEALRFRFTDHFLMRTSYEYATRLPDVSEAFGDFLDVNPNPALLPETSNNVNAGVLYTGKKLKLELNGFYRNTDHIIYLKTSRFFSQNQNLLKAETRGGEMEVHYNPFTFLSFAVNATYQDIRNKSLKENSGVDDNRYYNARMPNIPYFFGNAEIRILKEKMNTRFQNLQLWWNMGYVHEFYLYWATDGDKDKKAIIPHQFVQNAGISITCIKNTVTLCVEVFNLTDEKTYDNFNIQKPGRSFSLKLRYFIQKNKYS